MSQKPPFSTDVEYLLNCLTPSQSIEEVANVEGVGKKECILAGGPPAQLPGMVVDSCEPLQEVMCLFPLYSVTKKNGTKLLKYSEYCRNIKFRTNYISRI